MSVIIPNMNMPMSCLPCPLAREMFGCLVCVGFFKDNLTGRRVYESDLEESDTDFNRPDWCPLVPLPEGHGRIVDAAEILEKANNSPWFDGDVSELGLLLGSEVTTIVPSEGGTDDGV